MLWCVTLAFIGVAKVSSADESLPTSGPSLKVPDGYSIQLVASSPLVQRPITAAFDDAGRLYVADSSGSNDPVEKQLEDRPHRIVRLEDTDSNGFFDKSTVFADRMMFPSGTMFYGGSLYVSAPPSIWKLTDTNEDGIADERTEWLQGKTLTGCANDLHGPYLGPDGWFYWCKGAFAEQTYQVNGRDWTTRAAHIYRSRPDGSNFEPVLTGGMDNPVDVAHTSTGERVLTSTFLIHPAEGLRDGLIHSVHGGVYGKDHGVLEGHARTGDLMPTLRHMGPAAPCGLERYDGETFGEEYRDNFFACQFNLHKVSRHILRPVGSTFTTEDSDFVTSDNANFYPTDVLIDADGSLLIVNTGGWYKLCCPSSQLWEPNVLGGIYRVRKVGAKAPANPRGLTIGWSGLAIGEKWKLLSDLRPAVRKRATNDLAQLRESKAVKQLLLERITPQLANEANAHTITPTHVWALAQINTPESRQAIRALLRHSDEQVRHTATNVASLYRDAACTSELVEILKGDTPPNLRAAAEALGRIGDKSTVKALLAAAARADDRVLRHSITYALIEIGDPAATSAGLSETDPRVVACAAIALDQMPGGAVEASQIIPYLDADNEQLRGTAYWLVSRHSNWDGELTAWIETQWAIAAKQRDPARKHRIDEALDAILVDFADQPAVQKLLESAASDDRPIEVRRLALQTMSRAKVARPPAGWLVAITSAIHEGDPDLLPIAIAAARALPATEPFDSQLQKVLIEAADNRGLQTQLRVDALAIVAAGLPELSSRQFDLLIGALAPAGAITLRSSAADALSRAKLSPAQLDVLCDCMHTTGPLEIHRLLEPFARGNNDALGLKLIASLRQSPALSAVRLDVVRETLAGYGPAVQHGLEELYSLMDVDIATQRKRIEELLPRMQSGNVHRGREVFNSTKAACVACHRIGYAGGFIGPDLTRIGEIRSERDLLESIIYPSLSFVRSFEPVTVITTGGKVLNGQIRHETASEILLATGPNQEVRLQREDVDDLRPSTVSTMPAGFDKLLTIQELADLVAFLQSMKSN